MVDAYTFPLIPFRWSEALLQVRAKRTNTDRPDLYVGASCMPLTKILLGVSCDLV